MPMITTWLKILKTINFTVGKERYYYLENYFLFNCITALHLVYPQNLIYNML